MLIEEDNEEDSSITEILGCKIPKKRSSWPRKGRMLNKLPPPPGSRQKELRLNEKV
jgi:hypothetical protein